MLSLASVDTSISPSGHSLHYHMIAPDPTSLYLDLSSRYDIEEENILLGSQSFTMLRVRNTNALLQQVHPAAFAVDERLPYWTELWPASIELARYCLEESSMCGRSVLEVGCGLGLAGIAAASAGAHVLFTDYESDALMFARYNAIKNLPRDSIDSRVEFRNLDWRSEEKVGAVDMIIGADVVYEHRSFLPILKIVRRALTTHGCGVFTDPDRSTGMSFFALAEQEGFDVALSSRSLVRGNKTSTILLGELRPARQRT
jgi:predicted nicotinamide N-methyase